MLMVVMVTVDSNINSDQEENFSSDVLWRLQHKHRTEQDTAEF